MCAFCHQILKLTYDVRVNWRVQAGRLDVIIVKGSFNFGESGVKLACKFT